MRYASLPPLEWPASRVVLGTMALSPENQDLAFAILDQFVAAGGNLIDTAHTYQAGGSERVLGAWLRSRGIRDQVMLLTKGGIHAPDRTKRVTPEEIAFDLGQSLERLGVSMIDLYLLHRDDPARPVGPIVETLHYQASKGRMRAYGGSNWTHERLEAANDYARVRGLQPFAASSPNLSLAVPNEPMWPDCISVSGDTVALKWYRRTQLPLLSWSSQGGGFFSGRFTPEDTSDANAVRVYYSADNWERYRRAQQLARKMGCSPVQIALGWVLNQPELATFALIGPRSLDELKSSLTAADLEISPEQVTWLESPSPLPAGAGS